MFGKKNSEDLANQSGRSFIGESMQIEGDVESTGSVDIAGLVNGNIVVKEMNILETGSVIGNLNSVKVNINGHLEGEITAEEITLGKDAVVKGDVTFRKSLKTEEGAEIDGYIKGNKIKKNVREEYLDIEKIKEKPELGKPTLVNGPVRRVRAGL